MKHVTVLVSVDSSIFLENQVWYEFRT